MSELTIGAGYVRALLDLAVSKGANQQALLQESGLNLDDLQDRDVRIPLDNYQALMMAGKKLCDEPALAIQLGESTSLSDISIVGLIYKSASTNAEAFEQINRYGRLVVEVDGHRPEGRFKIVREGDQFWMVDTRNDPNSFPELTESAFTIMVCTQENAGHSSFAKAIHFTHPEPANLTEYERILRKPLVFGSHRNAILFDPSLMSLELPKGDGYAFGIFSERADALMASLQNSKTTKGQVESLLIPILHTGTWKMERLASALGLGRQTLYRRLKSEGTSFEKLLDDLRYKMAEHYLHGKKVSVNETAYLTGYSDPSAFSRAYKRWTGKSPTLTD